MSANLDYQNQPLRVFSEADGGQMASSQIPSGNTELDATRIINAIERSRQSQNGWAITSLKDRLRCIHKLRMAIAANPVGLAKSTGRENIAETLSAEVLPLADACKFLETNARRILRDRKLGTSGRPMWLWGNQVRLCREPVGVVLVIGPSNYPLMLPGIQAIQALAAGNCVLIKPAPGYSEVANQLAKLAHGAGVPKDVFQVLPEESEAATEAMQHGVDKVILTGSIHTGKAVSRELTESSTPAVMELSGCDAVFVLNDANMETVTDCLAFGLTLNAGRTCIAPRRVFASNAMIDQITPLLVQKIERRKTSIESTRDKTTAESKARTFANELIEEAIEAGAKSVPTIEGVTILDHVTPEMKIAQSDAFVPVLSFLRVESPGQALEWSRSCPYALGATIFGSTTACQQFAKNIDAGCVVINDMIAPTADPRIPFGGRHASGFGITRGAAGLEEMTQLKAVVTSRRWFRPHLDEPTPVDADVLENLIRLEHASSPLHQLSVVPGMIASTLAQIKHRSKTKSRESS